MMPSECPSHTASGSSGFMPQPPVPHARGEAERIEKNKSAFAWIDAVVISAGHMSETMTPTSPVINDLIDLFTTSFSVDRSSPGVLPLALAHQLPVHKSSGMSILDLDCHYSGPPVPPDLKHATITISLNSAPPTGDLLLLHSERGALDSADGGSPNPAYLCLIESPPSSNLELSGTLTTRIPPHLRGASEYHPIQKEMGKVERMRTVVEVVISAPKEAKLERKDARSPILGPIIPAKTALHSEVGHAAWARWVTENATETSVSSHTSNPPRQNSRSWNTRGGISAVPKNGKAVVNPKGSGRVTVALNKGDHVGVTHVNMTRSSSGNNNLIVSNGTSDSSQVKLTVRETHGHPVRAVSSPTVTPILAQRVVTLAPPEVAPVTWSGSGLPFEGLASRCGIDVTLGTEVITTQKRPHIREHPSLIVRKKSESNTTERTRLPLLVQSSPDDPREGGLLGKPRDRLSPCLGPTDHRSLLNSS
ncbi:hypothetical protein L873DRAFT_331195 [Choiromyces venosus 120613-1]|uniref:Uncharacterized protein n=1 Tax=Choiromyces venosus 120613-1 TaxID=1336337 RepID=A0A3N4JXA1_9PEZI|nr:hypothetical protein L873DRAFT_331195 [Choiromyces venosus 120613-1]